ncbi:zinc-binding dehydrogenase [Sphingorhabdus contaminans]|uniref:Zinc-binding dehydrogenase n=1 Tax=Sphingorhabdus contaminans TaxID=1343899 RepID=A0A553WAE8_9SPHN|nr:zinc-binding dehydrogenase [Sphingorhabdus contaminans]TSB01668.1 zinc-binding dehydrogenase [Sphingorhabdus contaminans]
MSQKTVAAVLRQSGDQPRPYAEHAPLSLETLYLEHPRSGELLVRIDAAGICHSDLSVINGDRPRPMPMALGHEAAATVIATGTAGDPEFKPGDRVVLVFLPACGQCPECHAGRGYLCPHGAAANGEGRLLAGGRRLSCETGDIHHHLGVSAFASHAVVDKRSAVKIDADIPPEIAALFGCAVLTGVGAVMNTALARPGESLLIYGLGGVGLAALLGAVAAGCVPVLAVDPSPEKRALALELGAAVAVAPDEAANLPKCDIVIETVGKAAVLAQAYGAARRGGRIVTVGLPNPSEMLSIPALSLVADSKTLMGSYMGSSIPSRDIPRYIALWRAGRLPVDRLLSSVEPLSHINSLMDILADGNAIRQVVVP